MYHAQYQHMIEIQGLTNKIRNLNKNIDEENKRLDFIKRKQDETLSNIEQLKLKEKELSSSISRDEKELSINESKLQKAKEHSSLLTNDQQLKANEKEIDTLTPLVENLENSIFEKLEEVDSLKQEILKNEQFLEGSMETEKEILNEVQTATTPFKKETEQLSSRIKLLIEQLDPSVQKFYLQLFHKFEKTTPIAMLKNGNCTECQTNLGRHLENQVELGVSLEVCMGCGRLLVCNKI